MRVLLDVSHPKDVNVFTKVIQSLQERGHSIKLVARSKENTKNIIEKNGLYAEYGPHYTSFAQKIIGIPYIDYWLLKTAKAYKPDLFVSFGSPYSAQVSYILRKPHLAFIDTEIASFAIHLMLPFTSAVYTSNSFTLDLGEKQKRFNSYLELAYLSPEYFTPDRDVLAKYALSEKTYIILRLSALSSHHDINAHGFSFINENDLRDYIEKLGEYGRVIIFSEKSNWDLVGDYNLAIDPDDFHSVLYYSKIYIGEGATMASEAAILGVPSIYVSNTKRGYLDELEDRYNLCYTLTNKHEALEKAISLLETENYQMQWIQNRKLMLDEKIDIVKYIVNEVENRIQ